MIRDIAMQSLPDAAATTTKATLVSLVTMMLSWDANYQVLGFVSLNVLLAAVIGALLGIGYGDPIVPRRRLLTVALVNACLAAALVAVLPHVPLLGWIGKASAGAIALLVAFALRWIVPVAIQHGPVAIRAQFERWASRGKSGTPGGGS